jgi:hypothetical protein
MEQLISLKPYEIEAAYVKALVDLDFTDLTMKQLISLKNYEVEAMDWWEHLHLADSPLTRST